MRGSGCRRHVGSTPPPLGYDERINARDEREGSHHHPAKSHLGTECRGFPDDRSLCAAVIFGT
jgi:hypothetical protein